MHIDSKTLALLAGLALAGCATPEPVSSMLNSSTAADPRLTHGQNAQFFSTSSLVDCAAVAGVSLVSCGSNSFEDTAACMLTAGIAGCGVALGAGYYDQHYRQEYPDTAERHALMAQDVRADTDRVLSRTTAAQEVIADNLQELAALASAEDNPPQDLAVSQSQLSRIDQNLRVLHADQAGMQKRLNQYQKVLQLEQQQTKANSLMAMDIELDLLQNSIDAFTQQLNRLYKQRDASRQP